MQKFKVTPFQRCEISVDRISLYFDIIHIVESTEYYSFTQIQYYHQRGIVWSLVTPHNYTHLFKGAISDEEVTLIRMIADNNIRTAKIVLRNPDMLISQSDLLKGE